MGMMRNKKRAALAAAPGAAVSTALGGGAGAEAGGGGRRKGGRTERGRPGKRGRGKGMRVMSADALRKFDSSSDDEDEVAGVEEELVREGDGLDAREDGDAKEGKEELSLNAEQRQQKRLKSSDTQYDVDDAGDEGSAEEEEDDEDEEEEVEEEGEERVEEQEEEEKEGGREEEGGDEGEGEQAGKTIPREKRIRHVSGGREEEEEQSDDSDDSGNDHDEEDKEVEEEGDGGGGGGGTGGAFAAAFSSIMSRKIAPTSEGPILAARKKLVQDRLTSKGGEGTAKHKDVGQQESTAQRLAAARERLEQRERNHVLPLTFTDAKERALIKVATKGVVRLFNAVSRTQQVQQSTSDLRGTSAGAKEAAKRTKAAFLSELRGAVRAGGGGAATGLVAGPKDGLFNAHTSRLTSGLGQQQQQQQQLQQWAVLRDDLPLHNVMAAAAQSAAEGGDEDEDNGEDAYP